MIADKKVRLHALLIGVFALHFALFAIYLKSSSESAHQQSPVIKVWADPDRTLAGAMSDVKIVPVCALFIFAAALLPWVQDHTLFVPGLPKNASPVRLFFAASNWLRPPPLQ